MMEERMRKQLVNFIARHEQVSVLNPGQSGEPVRVRIPWVNVNSGEEGYDEVALVNPKEAYILLGY